MNGDVDIWIAAGYKANPFPTPPVRTQHVLPGAGVPVVLGIVALPTYFIPASRATRVSPLEALRY